MKVPFKGHCWLLVCSTSPQPPCHDIGNGHCITKRSNPFGSICKQIHCLTSCLYRSYLKVLGIPFYFLVLGFWLKGLLTLCYRRYKESWSLSLNKFSNYCSVWPFEGFENPLPSTLLKIYFYVEPVCSAMTPSPPHSPAPPELASGSRFGSYIELVYFPFRYMKPIPIIILF